MLKQFTTIIHTEDDFYVALCPELDIASQGSKIEEAKDNLKEAVELFFECASEEEIKQRSQLCRVDKQRASTIDAGCALFIRPRGHWLLS